MGDARTHVRVDENLLSRLMASRNDWMRRALIMRHWLREAGYSEEKLEAVMRAKRDELAQMTLLVLEREAKDGVGNH